jgi:CheY-like chemotaxis protein
MEHSSTSSASAVPAPAAPQALRILYADDLPELRDLARTLFNREGHGVDCCADGSLALAEITSNHEYDLVVTDHHMPNMNGLEFVRKLRELAFRGKIMVFSSELSDSVAHQYREQNVDRILYKPIIPSALRRILTELFPPGLKAA